MRRCLIVACMWTWIVAACWAGEPSRSDVPSVRDILREASVLALAQEPHQHYWTQQVLLRIGELQTQVGDFDGALTSIRGSANSLNRQWRMADLAEAVARSGDRPRALELARPLHAGEDRSRADLENRIHGAWIDHLISTGDHGRAATAATSLKSPIHCSAAWRKLAAARAKSGDSAEATTHFRRAVSAAELVTDETERSRAFQEVAAAQLTVGAVNEAKATIRQLTEVADFKNLWVKFNVQRECALMAAKANDATAARRLFRRASEISPQTDKWQRIDGIKRLAISQAEAGFIDDALRTAVAINPTKTDIFQECDREEVLLAVATAQVKANDTEAAMRTAMSIKDWRQFRDDAIHLVVDHLIAKSDLEEALAAAGNCDGKSRKASAMLKVAVARAKRGDTEAAVGIAGRIDLAHAEDLIRLGTKERFDHRRPATWAKVYEARDFFSFTAIAMWHRHAAEVAAASMALEQALGRKPFQSYAALFDDIDAEEITQALARSHAFHGNAREALKWAQEIGSGGKAGDNDYRQTWAVERRLHALIGVAEGMLDRPNNARK